MAGIVLLYGRRSADIWQEERRYMAVGTQLYGKRIVVI
jgi:hypothetical protein